MKKGLLYAVMLLCTAGTWAQISSTVEPRGWDLIFKNQPVKQVLPALNLLPYQIEDARAAQNELQTKPYRFGVKRDVDIDLFKTGSWTQLENGDRIWRVNIKSPGARTINFMFDRYSLPQGAELYIYTNDRSDFIGPYTANENQEDGFLGSWIVYGEDAWIEYFEPAAVKGQGRVSINKLVHGYRGFGAEEETFLKLNESGACNVDVNCDPNVGNTSGVDWTTVRDNYRHSVARIIINGAGLCTGTLVNNVREDGIPYFLTANHCLGNTPDGTGSAYPASNWVFGFDWFATSGAQCATFSNTTGPASPTRILSGAVLKANLYASDMALFELNTTPPAAWNLFYSGWNRSATASTAQLGVHHPSGDIMKLCRNDQTVTTLVVSGIQCWNVANWDYGVTEGGSSGSCLIDRNGHIVGQLLGGGAACSGTTDNNQLDYYGKMNISWSGGFNSARRLRDWLDPDNTNAVTQDGVFTTGLGVADSSNLAMVTVSPNPSQGLFFINNIIDTVDYQVFDLAGKLLASGTATQGTTSLDLKSFSDGLYLLKVNQSGTERTFKLIKQ